VLERLPDELGDVEHDFEAFAVLASPHLARQCADDVVQPPIALVVGEVRDAADQLARAAVAGSCVAVPREEQGRASSVSRTP
jgi:hypothetical protein